MNKSFNQSLVNLINEKNALIDQRWSSNLAADLKLTIKRCLLILAENCPADDPVLIADRKVLIQQIYNLLIQRVGTGFVFDEAPSATSNQIHYLDLDPKLSFDHQPNFIGGGGAQSKPHHLIIGENYYALQNLIAAGYRNRVDIIYIDPPYNTKKFQSYKDERKRCGWLTMMKERLELAHQLLSENGVIFVSIDDAEQAYLKIIMDQIWGESQFVGIAIRRTRTAFSSLKNNFNKQHDYCLIYQNNPDNQLNGESKKFSKYQNPDNDPNGNWCSDDPTVGLAMKGKNTNLFSITNPITGQIDWPPVNRQWQFTKSKLKEYIASGKIKFRTQNRSGQRGFIFKRYQSEIKNLNSAFDSLKFTNNEYTNARATRELRKIIGTDFTFFYPKPVNFIQEIIAAVNNPHAIVLDFFAGTGTTGHAVLELNRQDGGQRQFILCTNNEAEIDKLCYERIYRIMTGQTTKGKPNFSWLDNNQPYGGSLKFYRILTENCGFNSNG